MRIGASGILVSQNGELLLIQRNDTRTFSYPGGTIDTGELPTDGVVREVREETGLIVLPVRLVGLNFREFPPHSYLNFTFRCLLRGGEVTPSPESPHVGFYPPSNLPKPMASFSRKRIETALNHVGGPVVMDFQEAEWDTRIGNFLLQKIIYPYFNWRRARRGEPAYIEPTSWQVSAYVVIKNEVGEILLCQDNDLKLPGGLVKDNVPPWETAVSLVKSQTNFDVQIENLESVYITKEKPQMSLIFTATTNATQGNWVQSDDLPQNVSPHHQTFIQNSNLLSDETDFFYLEM